MITPFRGTPVGLSTLTSTPTTHASTRAGDFLVLAVHGFWATSLGTGGITPPAGYTLIKRSDQALTGTNVTVVAHYYKVAAANGAVADTVTFDAGFTGSSTQTTITTYAGATGLTGTAQDFAGANVSAYSPPLAGASVYARNVIGHMFQGSTASPISTANSWTTVQTLAGAGTSGHILELTDRAPSMTAPALNASTHAGISYALISDGPAAIVHTGKLR